MTSVDSRHTDRALPAHITVERWGTLPGGDAVRLFTLRNAHGMRVVISDLGATLVSWHAADRAGRIADIVLGHDTPAEYLASASYFGGTIGRWANRIAQARFTLDGLTYQLDRNEGDNLLHGGASGFHRALWDAREVDGTLVFSHESPEGDAGFPGALETTVRYALDDHGALTIDYDAVTDAPTPVNLTHHAYFNLSGGPADIRGHMIEIDADEFWEVDDTLIPLARASVAGNAFDFRSSAPIGARLDWPHAQLARAKGFDHCYLLRDAAGASGAVRRVAVLYDPGSGRELTVETDAHGLQFYTGNYLEGVAGRGGERLRKHAALCLETGGYPNQINMADSAAQTVLRPGERYRHTTVYRLGIR
ncbi:aldose epimerase family protein [Paraburkholderia solisilvae]|uniref:Aldose 1-epimerase n=1 Tax=Paraburkholderia solisilvae TaxID=624376 RepID=A0A6J5ER31_9BURK|nr:aldose epimerase family protein [Paraburkholderia solisilvae]CAB3767891.1 Aldose 1-epimerase [Paraburkholderia solisilvae]